MNYKKIYINIIRKAKKRKIDSNTYFERHHIIPKSFGGNNKNYNIVKLTAREHFICHLLLTKIFKFNKVKHIKMVRAFFFMSSNSKYQNRYINSRFYEKLKIEYSDIISKNQSKEKNSQYGTIWIINNKKEKSIKIKKEELNKYLKNGWKKGRIIKFNEKFNGKNFFKENGEFYSYCKECSKKFINKSCKKIFCNEKCKKKHQFNLRYTKIEKNDLSLEFKNLYIKHKSANKRLKLMGFPGNVGWYNKWAKELIELYSL